MHSYSIAILVLGAVAAFLGVENLIYFGLSRRRMHLWVSLAGLGNGAYCLFSSRVYAAATPEVGGSWQPHQLTAVSVLVASSLFLGLEHLGRLHRRHGIVVLVPTSLLAVLAWVPGVATTSTPSVKHIRWLGVTYNEMVLGPIPTALIACATALSAYVTVLLVRRAWRGSRQDRTIAAVFVIWVLAGLSDTLVVSGVYASIYLLELAFLLVVVVVASMLLGEQHRSGLATERDRRRLALEVLARDRDLATTQAELTQAAKLVAVGHLAAGVAHEVNNPLTYIMTNLQVLETELSSEEHRAMTQEALQGARRIATVVRQLSAFARPETETAAGSVAAAIDSATRLASVQLNDLALLELEVPELPPVTIGEGQLAQVLLNLLINAAHAIPPGRRREHSVRVTARRTEATVEIVVQDSGSGIPEEALPHVFEPFFTTKTVGQGQGLGLAISKSLIDKAGGRIVAGNAPGGGARIVIELPIHTPAQDSARRHPQAAGPQAGTAPSAATRTLLLVDDDATVLRSLQLVLSRVFRVETATGGKQALELLAQGRAFDLLLCDVMMPEGSGLEVAETLARSYPHLLPRLILMTGGAPTTESGLLARLPAVPVLHKPFSLDDLLRLVASTKQPQGA